jgi:hypothetical protein
MTPLTESLTLNHYFKGFKEIEIMYKMLPVLLFILALVFTPCFNGISYAQTERNKATLMKEHMTRMKNKNPGKYQRMVDNAKSGVSDCISCHVKGEDKKSHFRFVNPHDPVTPGK